jgi:hypothetical protein
MIPSLVLGGLIVLILAVVGLDLYLKGMKLQKLAGYGPTAAFVSAGSLFVLFFLMVFGNPIFTAVPALTIPIYLVWLLALWLWLGALAVLVLDLEWLEHPATTTRWFQVAHWATLAAVFLPVLFGIELVSDKGWLGTIVVSLLVLCVGLTLLIHNINARRAGLLKGALPWIGIVAGVAYLLVAIFENGLTFGIYLVWFLTSERMLQETVFGADPPAHGIFAGISIVALWLGQVFYIAWAIWMGVNLGSSKAAPPVHLAPS